MLGTEPVPVGGGLMELAEEVGGAELVVEVEVGREELVEVADELVGIEEGVEEGIVLLLDVTGKVDDDVDGALSVLEEVELGVDVEP